MANSSLQIENLDKLIESGTVGGKFNVTGNASQKRIEKEMMENGLNAPLKEFKEQSNTFSQMLTEAVDKVNHDQLQANQAIQELVAGRTKNVHETMLAVERADTSLKLMMQVRNKILDAYKEIMRMRV